MPLSANNVRNAIKHNSYALSGNVIFSPNKEHSAGMTGLFVEKLPLRAAEIRRSMKVSTLSESRMDTRSG